MSILKSGYTVEHLAAMPSLQLYTLVQSLPRDQADEVLAKIPLKTFADGAAGSMTGPLSAKMAPQGAGWASTEDQQDFGVRR